MSPVVPALLFLAIACALIFAIIAAAVRAFGGFDIFSALSPDRRSARRAAKKIRSLDSLIRQVRWNEAADMALGLISYSKASSEVEIDRIRAFNQIVLNKIVVIAKGRGSPAVEEPLLEELLALRSELLKSHLDTLRRSKARTHRGQAPAWGAAEFSKKLAEIDARLLTNQRNLVEKLTHALRVVTNAGDGDSRGVTYH